MRTQFVIPVLLSILILGILGSFTSQFAYAAPGDFISSFDGTAGGGTEFSFVNSITADSNDRIIVVDASADTVQIFNSTGSFVSSFDGTAGDGTQFISPSGITTDSNDRIIVGDTFWDIVQIFNSTGSFVGSFDGTAGDGTEFTNPRDVATDSNNRIIVVDFSPALVQIFNPAGSFVRSFDGTAGDGTQFIFPRGVAVDSNDRIIVADTGLNIVQIYNSTGPFVGSFNGTAGGGTQFLNPFDVAVDSNDRIIVGDDDLNIVQIFNSTGSFLSSFNGTSGGGTEFSIISGVTTDSNNRIIVGDFGLAIVQIFEGFSHETFTTVSEGLWDSEDTWEDSNGDPGVPEEADDKVVNHIITMSSPVVNSGLISIEGGTLIVDSALTNAGFDNGVIKNGIVNSGIINFTSNAVVNNNGLFENDFGSATLDNGGKFNNNLASGNGLFQSEESTFFVKGTFTNFGKVRQFSNGVMTIFNFYNNTGSNAVFDNRLGAEIRVDSIGLMWNELGATIDNQGTINIISGSSLISTSGTITNNKETGTININGTSSLFNNAGTMNNEGAINNMGEFRNNDILNNKPTGIIKNNKTLINLLSVSVLNNEGILENNDIFGNVGITNNKPTGTINNTKRINNQFGSTLNNEGLLENHDILWNGGIINNTKTLTNKVGSTLENDGTIENRDMLDNDGTLNNKEDAILTNFDGGNITNNGDITNAGEIKNNGTITNKDTLTNTGTLNNDNYIENEKQIDNTSGTINNTCLINNSGSVPNTGGVLKNQNTITNNGAIVFQPGGKFENSGTLNGNKVVNILEDEIIPEEDKINGRIVVVTPDRLAKPTDKAGQLPLKGAKLTFSHSGPPIMKDSDRTNGNFSFNVPAKKDTVSLETILKDGTSPGFPNGLLEVHNAAKSMPVKFKTENFNSCIRIAFLELNATSPELRVSGMASTPTLTGLPQVARLADLAALYYYSLIGFDFFNNNVTAITPDASLPLEVVGYSTSANTQGASHFDPPTISIHLQSNDPHGLNLVGSKFASGTATEYQIDVLYHEFGHYLVYESKIGGENDGINTNRIIHPSLTGLGGLFASPSGCHSGYAQLDSSCSWSEGFASYISSVMADMQLNDSKHAKFNSNVYNFAGGGVDLNQSRNVFGGFRGNQPIFSPGEEWAIASLLWTFPEAADGLITKFVTPANNPTNAEIITTVSDLYTVLKNSGSPTAQLNTTFGNYKICDDKNNNLFCEAGDVFGVTAWKNVTASNPPMMANFSYPHPPEGSPRAEVPPYFPEMVSFDVMDLTGNTIMDGTEVTIETVLSGGQNFTHTAIVYDGKIFSTFNLPEGSHVNLLFFNDDYVSESVTINAEEYFDGFGDQSEFNSLAFDIEMALKCIPPDSGNWTISLDCVLEENTIATGNVTITNTSVMEIPSGKTLTITSGNNIRIEKDSGLMINANGTVQINS